MRVKLFDGKFIKVDRIDGAEGLSSDAVLQITRQDTAVAQRVTGVGRKYAGLCVRSQCFPEWRNGELFLRGNRGMHDDDAFIVPRSKLGQVVSALVALEQDLASKDGEVVEIDGRKYRLSLVKED